MVTLEKPSIQTVRAVQGQYRLTLTLGLLLLGLALVVGLSLTQGSVAMTGPELWAALLRQGNATHQVILWDLRLPRLVAALLVGAALGVSGALLQGMLRNGLASPFLLGISSGAGLVVVLVVTLGLWQVWVPLGAWLGAIATTALVYLLAYRRGGLSVERLILGGVAFSSFFGAIQSLLLLMARDGRIQAALNWLIGSFNGRGWAEMRLVGPAMVVAVVASCLLARQVNVLNLGDDLAVGLGTSLVRSRLLIGAAATFLAAGAASIAGLVGFVGLIVPHGVRLLVGTDYRLVLPVSALG
ncbi:iron ABC transporter permease, partial [Nodosilinea sp. LEGE 07298]|uniref:FecCD family ABC transporter permease n=1 Tax=Nodosilinea sp. LEGE 07298 TaxID=2777970 RepID=UPI00187EA9E4